MLFRSEREREREGQVRQEEREGGERDKREREVREQDVSSESVPETTAARCCTSSVSLPCDKLEDLHSEECELLMYCMCVCVPGEAVQGFDEVVPGPLVPLRALQQGGGGVHHVAGQETVLETKMDAKRLDADVLHAGGDGGGTGSGQAAQTS